MSLIAYPTVRVVRAERRQFNASRPWRAKVLSYHFSLSAALRDAIEQRKVYRHVWLEAVKEGVSTNGKVRRKWR